MRVVMLTYVKVNKRRVKRVRYQTEKGELGKETELDWYRRDLVVVEIELVQACHVSHLRRQIADLVVAELKDLQ
jgi:hypothetical protein